MLYRSAVETQSLWVCTTCIVYGVSVWYVGMQAWMGSLEKDFNERQNSLNPALAREPQ